MNSVKSYFKLPPDTSGVPENIFMSDKIEFSNNTATYDMAAIQDMLATFMEKFNNQYMVAQPIPSSLSAVTFPSTRTFPIEPEISRAPRVITNKTRKIRSPKEKEIGLDEDVLDTEAIEEEEEEEHNEEEYQLVTDIITTRQTLDTGYIVIPETKYFLNNRPIFTKFLERMFGNYAKFLKEATTPGCDSIRSDNKLSLLVHQKLISDYMNINTPYRGVLLFHGLGSGKTCSSIAISEQFKNTNKRIYILTPASLAPNYEKELKKCGNIIFRLHNNWQWVEYDQISSQTNRLEPEMYLPKGYIREHGGVWILADPDRAGPSKSVLNNITRKKSITDQINKMLTTKYTFVHYNGVSRDYMKKITKNHTINPFDNSVVIIDEVHKLVNAIVNNMKKLPKSNTDDDYRTYGVSLQLYGYLLKAQHARIVLLTGTPLVNSPNEIAVMFNMITGLIHTIECVLTINTTEKINTETIVRYLREAGIYKYLSYIKYEPSTKRMVMVKNETGFVNVGADEMGVVYDPLEVISKSDFERQVKNVLTSHSISIKTMEEKTYKQLPETYDQFMGRFYSNKEIINVGQLKARIYGLTSYYSGTPELLPVYDKSKDYHIVKVPMSTYQFGEYIKVREPEQQHEKNRSMISGKTLFKEQSSTYRIGSRLACNFVLPEEVLPKVSPGTPQSQPDEVLYKTFDSDYVETVDEDIDVGNVSSSIRKNLIDHSGTLLTLDGLSIYSPKIRKIIENIIDPDHIGLHLVYSQFRHLSGLELLGMALKENGFVEMKVVHTTKGWILDIPKKDLAKPKFAFYTGKEPAIVKEILLNIYNGFLDNIPRELTQAVSKISTNNNYGELIKLFMITASGAEGIDLKNTRFVHLMEPYWNMVRIEQVIGRAVRICSHKNLPPEHQTVQAFLYISVFPEDQLTKKNPNQIMLKDTSRIDVTRPITTDEFLNEVAVTKDLIMSQLLRILKETSIDCSVYPNNAKENLVCYKATALDPKSGFTYAPDYLTDLKTST